MGNITINLSNTGGQSVPITGYLFAVRQKNVGNFIYVSSNTFTNLSDGIYEYSIKKDGSVIANGEVSINNESAELPYTTQRTGSLFVIPQSEHGKTNVRDVVVYDTYGDVITRTHRLDLSNETVTIELAEQSSVTIRIF